jgi:hypothetical protein
VAVEIIDHRIDHHILFFAAFDLDPTPTTGERRKDEMINFVTKNRGITTTTIATGNGICWYLVVKLLSLRSKQIYIVIK